MTKPFFTGMLWWCVATMSLLSQDIVRMQIHGNDYLWLKERYDAYETKGEAVKLYREEPNFDLTYLLSVVLEEKSGGCGARGLIDGAYRTEGDVLKIYTRWRRELKAQMVPEGYRVQTYRFDANGTLRFISGKLYVRTAQEGFADEGMRYIDGGADTPEKKAALQRYIKEAEARFKATFVRDNNARDALKKEVEEALRQKARKRWR